MRSLAGALLLLASCASPAPGAAPLAVATFVCDATPPLGNPLAGKKPAEVVDEPLLLKGVVLEDGGSRYVVCALDWCTLSTANYALFRSSLAAAAGTSESRVTVHCTHTHSAPSGGGAGPDLATAVAQRAAGALRESLPRKRRFTHVGIGRAEVVEYASNRRVPGPGGKILVRYSATKDPALRAQPRGLVDPKLRTVTLLDDATPVVRMHYYASHPQSYYGDGRVHPDVPGWARAELEKEEGIPHLYFTGCGGNITAGKFNDGSPEARERLIDRLSDGMRRSIASTTVHPTGGIAWKTLPVRMQALSGTEWPPIDLIRLTLGPAEIVHLPGEPFVEYQLHAVAARPDRFVAVAGYGDGGPGYICTDVAHAEGGYEPTASRVGPPTEARLKAALSELLEQPRKLRVVVFGGHPDDPESGAGGLMAALSRAGHEVISAYGTCFRGDRKLGGEPEGEVRRREAAAACKVLGATPKFFDYSHEKLVADAETLKAVRDWLDQVKPDIVVAHWPMDTHPNHHVVSSLVWQAYAQRGGWNLYHFEVMTGQQTLGFRPELYLDLSGVLETKRAALDRHASQNPGQIWEVHEKMHRARGAECGVERAEAYTLVESKESCALLPVPFLKRKAP